MEKNSIFTKSIIISIVIPVYNVENYLKECLDSVLNQTYDKYELILVNDGSTDNSGKICEMYAQKDPRIHVIHQNNEGQASARNKGVAYAKGEWIFFVDSDDVIHPQILEFLCKAVEDNNVPISTSRRIKAEIIPEHFFDKQYYKADCIEINESSMIELYRNNDNVYWALFPSLIKKEIVEKKKFTIGKIYEDNAVTCQWLCEAKNIAIVPNVLYFYRDNPNGTMRREVSIQKLDYLWALEEQMDYYIQIKYLNILKVIFQEYVGASIWISKQIKDELNNEKLQKSILKETKRKCKKYKMYISNYKDYISTIEKILHPYLYKLKKLRDLVIKRK